MKTRAKIIKKKLFDICAIEYCKNPTDRVYREFPICAAHVRLFVDGEMDFDTEIPANSENN